MPLPRTRAIGTSQRLTGYVILAILGIILVWLLWQQSRFNPAVTALQSPHPEGLFQTGPAASPQMVALFPRVAGFRPLGPVQSFGPENLSDKINGKAELYLAAGFQSLGVQSYILENPSGAYLEVFVYDMGAPQNAYAVFSSQRRPGATRLDFRSNAYATANAIFFTAGNFYVEMIMDRAVTDVAGVLAAFTTELLANLPAEAQVSKPAAFFPPQGLVADSVRLQAADAFGLAGFSNVYTADYTLPAGPATAFLAPRATAAEAAADARRYQEFLLANGFRLVPEPTIPAGITVLAYEDFFAAMVVVDQTLAGVHEAPSLAAALELTLAIQEAVRKNQPAAEPGPQR